MAERLFNNRPDLFYEQREDLPSVMFTHPPIGNCGLTEEQAKGRYGEDNVKVYSSEFVNMHYAVVAAPNKLRQPSFFKMVCVGPEEKVVGVHGIGKGIDEMAQLFGVLLRKGVTK